METIIKNIFNKPYTIYNGKACCSNTNLRTLYIELTNLCNAKCPFCSNPYRTNTNLDISFLKKVLSELDGVIDKVTLTGGEPLLYPHLEELFEILDNSNIQFYALTTNGYFLSKQLEIINNSKLKYVNISRHHYLDDVNNKVFGIKIPKYVLPDKEIRLQAVITDIFNSKDDILKFIDYAKSNGINNVLIRKEYFSGLHTDGIENIFSNCDSCKISTKCCCKTKKINGVNVTYRTVDVEKEQKVEKERKYIRNFVLKANNHLYGGWSNNSIEII